jgi:hypothetical protein
MKQNSPADSPNHITISYPCDFIYKDQETQWARVWQSLVKRKTLFFTVFLVSALGFIPFAFIMPDQHEVATILEIGTLSVDGKPIPIQPAQTVIQKIRREHLPTESLALAKEHADKAWKYMVRAQALPDITKVRLTSTATDDQYPLYKQLHESLVRAIVAHHHHVARRKNKPVRRKLEQTELLLHNLQEEHKFSAAALQRAVEEAETLKNEISELSSRTDRNVEALKETRAATPSQAADPSPLALRLAIQSDLTRRSNKEQQLRYTLPNTLATLRYRIERNVRKSKDAREIIKTATVELNAGSSTRALEVARKASTPAKRTKFAFVVLGIALGALFGFIAVLLMEFARRPSESRVTDGATGKP